MTVERISNSNIANSIPTTEENPAKTNFFGRIVIWLKDVFSNIAEFFRNFFRRYLSADKTWLKLFPEGKVDIYNFSGGRVSKKEWNLECSKMLLENESLGLIRTFDGEGAIMMPDRFAADIARLSYISINADEYRKSVNIKETEAIYLNMQNRLGEPAAMVAARLLHQGGFAITSVEFMAFLYKHYNFDQLDHTTECFFKQAEDRHGLIRNLDTVTINMRFAFKFRLGNKPECFVAVGSKFILPHELMMKIGESDKAFSEVEVAKQVEAIGYYSKACSSEEEAMNDLIGRM